MKPRDCPKCDRHMTLYDTRHLTSAEGFVLTTSYYRCERCGYEDTKTIRREMPEEEMRRQCQLKERRE